MRPSASDAREGDAREERAKSVVFGAIARSGAPRCRERKMTIGVAHLQPIVALIAGVLILIMPRLLNYVVAIYLIVSGILGLGLIR